MLAVLLHDEARVAAADDRHDAFRAADERIALYDSAVAFRAADEKIALFRFCGCVSRCGWKDRSLRFCGSRLAPRRRGDVILRDKYFENVPSFDKDSSQSTPDSPPRAERFGFGVASVGLMDLPRLDSPWANHRFPGAASDPPWLNHF